MHENARLYLLLTRGLCLGSPTRTLQAALDGGVDLVQVREKPFGATGQQWIDTVCKICARHDVPVIVNDRLDLAARTAAAGAHLGQADLTPHARGSLRARDWVLGVSTHDAAELGRALEEAPDYVGVGPCFGTPTRPDLRGQGAERIATLATASPVPCFAIGGITQETLPELLAAGIRRVAVSAAILRASDPGRAARDLCRALDACS